MKTAEEIYETVLDALTDMDYNDGAMMRWTSGDPTQQAEKVARRITRDILSK